MADFLKALAPAAGAVAGLGIGAATGNPLAGLVVGQAAGGLLSSGLGLLEEGPQERGATGAQRQALGLQLKNIEAMQKQVGMSAQQIGRLQQLARGQSEQFAMHLNAIAANPSISPVDKEGLMKGLFAQTQRAEQTIQDRIAAMEEGAEARRLTATSQAAGAAANQAEQIRRADLAAEQREKAAAAAAQQAFAQDIGNLIQAVSAAALIPGKQEGIEVQGAPEMQLEGGLTDPTLTATEGLTLGDTTLQATGLEKGVPQQLGTVGAGQTTGALGEIAQFGKAREFSLLAGQGADQQSSAFLASMSSILGGI